MRKAAETNERAGRHRFPALLDSLLTLSPAALLVWLMLCQGGFFPLTAVYALGVCGILLAAWAILWGASQVKRKSALALDSRKVAPLEFSGFASLVPAMALLLVGCLYAASIVAHDLPAEAFVQCAPWVLGALTASACATLSEGRRGHLLTAVTWLGVVSAFAGVGIFVGVPAVPGAVNAGRLQFFFQYANAAGSWFACVALLCLSSKDSRLRRCTVAPLTALFLTQSMGSVLFFGIVAGAHLLVLLVGSNAAEARENGRSRRAIVDIAGFLVQGVAAVAVFLLFKAPISADAAEALAVAAFLGGSYVLQRFWPVAERALCDRNLVAPTLILEAVLLAAGAMLMIFLMQDRLVQAAATFGERIAQARDAWFVLTAFPELGVGPDQWQYVYSAIQSVEYEAALVHCSYLQLGLNAGALAPVALIAAFAASLLRGLATPVSPAVLPLAFLMLHSLVDFDLEFSFFVVLMAVMMGAACGSRSGSSAPPLPLLVFCGL